MKTYRVNDERRTTNKCECCDYVFQSNNIHDDILDLISLGLSDGYILARIYGKYKSDFSTKEINQIINNLKTKP